MLGYYFMYAHGKLDFKFFFWESRNRVAVQLGKGRQQA